MPHRLRRFLDIRPGEGLPVLLTFLYIWVVVASFLLAKPIRSGFRSWFGSVPNYAWDKKGVLIDGTSAGSPAEHAGFLKGDILLSMGDIKFDSINDFMFALETYKPGDVVLVKFTRDGQDQEIRVTLSTRGQQ